jgi:hypothetical protein
MNIYTVLCAKRNKLLGRSAMACVPESGGRLYPKHLEWQAPYTGISGFGVNRGGSGPLGCGVVEGTHSWMNRFRKTPVRFEKLESSYLGLLMLRVPSSPSAKRLLFRHKPLITFFMANFKILTNRLEYKTLCIK